MRSRRLGTAGVISRDERHIERRVVKLSRHSLNARRFYVKKPIVQNEHCSAGSVSRYIKSYERVTCALVLVRAVEEVAKGYRETLMDTLKGGGYRKKPILEFVIPRRTLEIT